MTIEKHGFLYNRKFMCGVCGCEFTLEPHDTDQIIYPPYLTYGAADLMARCPECGHGAEQEKI